MRLSRDRENEKRGRLGGGRELKRERNLRINVIGISRRALSRQTQSSTNISNSRLKFLHRELAISIPVELLELMVHEVAKHLLVPNQLHYIRTVHNLSVFYAFLLCTTILHSSFLLFSQLLVSLVSFGSASREPDTS